MGTHDGAVAVVTGASRGIGLGIARRLVDEGARVVVTGRKPEPLADAVEQLGGPGRALGVAGNAADEAHQDEVLAAARETFGGLDLLVNNTGINPVYGPMVDTDLAAARKIMEVNVLAAFSWTQKAVKAGLGGGAQRPGAVVNVASIAGLGATGSIGWYAVSKAALIHLTVELGYQLGPEVRVNAVAPAVVKTRFAEALYADREDAVAAAYPMKRLGVPEDVAGAVSFLLSRDASWITGQTLVVDGGVTLGGAL
ncbi:NAD(P)-dependent dehydrogenase, short-chain alcohol dehydrogenase family [Pedococcus cremeus]|uniref:NAD(P)-dependent dehydrogenase, short-chain alcohol dehydrogenase family n=1 Tax=Pedococcus cremeus TaxID=587636 RepID=A0A1H9UMY1_9MICO|nr:SDR family oxidoreductase [Pedococcus cremeus]SES10815.1 NAD(P)-dependent dehydrogenase, short-chain alcohol dehydrogenase family [Pedococcus cremeus]